MRNVLFFLLSFSITACVQPTHDYTVVYRLATKGHMAIQQAGIRGNDSPLSWQKDSLMQPLVKDSLYQVTIHYKTGYKFTEFKFTINGEFEKTLTKNRRVYFKGDTSFVSYEFDRK